MTSCNDDELVERLGNLGLGVNRELPNFDWQAIFDARDRICQLTEQLKEADPTPLDMRVLCALGGLRDDMPAEDVAAVQRFVDTLRSLSKD